LGSTYPPRRVSIEEAIDLGLASFEEQLTACRRVTEVSLAAAEQRGEGRVANEKRHVLTERLDRLEDEMEAYRVLLRHFMITVGLDPDGAGRWLDERVEPHDRDVLRPLLDGYRRVAEGEVSSTADEVSKTVGDTHRRTVLTALLALAALAALPFFLAQTSSRADTVRPAAAGQTVPLREVQGRVKNNLQVVSSMLRLQASDSPAEASRQLLESEGRIRAMALVHELLDRSSDLTSIDFCDYVHGLVGSLVGSGDKNGRSHPIEIDVEHVRLGLDLAIPCGLILNELLTNALRHAFADGREGKVQVGFRRENGRGSLTIADDGVGFLTPSASDATTSALGLRLVSALARQIQAEMSVDTTRGSKFTLEFPVPPPSTGSEADVAGDAA
jgi:two-component sensor histidine kinase